MKGKQFRVLEEIDGTEYRFSPDAFTDAMSNYVSNKRNTDKTYTKHKLMLEICEKGFTYDAVKKWKQGANGPGSVDIVKTIAETMNIEYSSLLTPVEKKEVITSVNEHILKIYQECLASVFRWTENMCGAKFWHESEVPNSEFEKSLNEIQEHIDMIGLALPNETLNKLHRIVYDLIEMIENSVPERLEETYCRGNETGVLECFYAKMWGYPTFTDKEDALRSLDEQTIPLANYISDEIDMAVELGYDKFKEIDNEDEFDALSIEEKLDYGYTGTEINITPQMIFKSKFRQSLCTIFRNDLGITI